MTPATWISIYLELGKARLSSLVLITTLAGYLAAPRGAFDWAHMLVTLGGTAMAALGANGLNLVLERDRDALMERTRERPLPSGRMGAAHAVAVSALTALVGCLVLARWSGVLPALLAAGTVLLYVVVYTPLKPRSNLNTMAGAVVGAIPPLIGWSAVTGGIETGGWLLGLLLFIWQIPHFLSLAWLYRDDYRRGGYKMVSVDDPEGDSTFRLMMIYAWVLLPLGLVMSVAGMAGAIFAAGSVLLGGAWLWQGIRCYRDRSRVNTRRVFLGSVMYLPLLLALLVASP